MEFLIGFTAGMACTIAAYLLGRHSAEFFDRPLRCSFGFHVWDRPLPDDALCRLCGTLGLGEGH